MSDLEDLLSRLAHTPKRPTTYLGKAVGKDEANLHLAVDTGVIAIPIAAITDVKRLETGVENAVSVEVSDATEITQIVKVRPVMAGQDPKSGVPGAPDPVAASGTWTGGGGATATAAAPEPGFRGIIYMGDDTHNGQTLDDVIYQ
jgi:hypothetical protein